MKPFDETRDEAQADAVPSEIETLTDELTTLRTQVSAITKERDEACAALEQCKAGWATLKKCAQAAKGSEAFEKCFVEMAQLSGHGTQFLDRLHTLEQGVKVAVEALYAVPPHKVIHGEGKAQMWSDALAHLTPLLTTPTKA